MELGARKYVQGYGFLSFMRKYKKIINRYRTRYYKHCFQKGSPLAGKFLGNKITDEVTKSNNDKVEKHERVEEIVFPPEIRDEILNKLRKVVINVTIDLLAAAADDKPDK